MYSYIALFSFVVAFSGIIISIIMMILSRNKSKAIWLFIHILVISMGILEPFFTAVRSRQNPDLWMEIFGGYSFLIGPSLYLYCRSAFEKEAKNDGRLMLHFIPLIFYLASLLTIPYSDYLEVGFYAIFIVQTFLYLIFSLRIVKVHFRLPRFKFLTYKINISVLHYFILILIVIFSYLTFVNTMALLGNPVWNLSGLQGLFLCYLLFILLTNTEFSTENLTKN